jgi:hypothetical protein
MAITEKYATSAGAGAKNGVDADNAWDWATMLTTADAGDRVNFKGNHTLTANAIFAHAGNVTRPLILRGYATNIGDGYLGRTNGNGPLILTNMPVITGGAYGLTMPSFSIVESISITSTKNSAVLSGGGNGAIVRCKAVNTGNDAASVAIYTAGYGICFDCDAVLSGAAGLAAITTTGSGAWVVDNRADGGAAAGIQVYATCAVIHNQVFTTGTDAILANTTSQYLLYGNTCVQSGSDGIHAITGPARLGVAINNLLTDNGAYGIYAVDAATPLFSAGNRTDRNTSGKSSGATDWLAATCYGDNTTVLANTSTPGDNEYVGPGSDDYRLKLASPARAAAALPYLDIGAVQRQEPTYPVIANVVDSAGAYGPIEAPITGTYHSPNAGEVVSTAVFGPASGTAGTVAVPGEDSVLDTVLVGDQSGGEKLGTYHGPEASEVWHTALFGDQFGGPEYGSKTASTITNCIPANVKVDVAIDDVTGDYTVPTKAAIAAAVWSRGERTLT